MKPLTVGFSAFVKLFSLSPELKKRELQKRFREGGYDFYWSMKRHISKIALGKENCQEAFASIDLLKNKSEREHNKLGVQRFDAWFNQTSPTCVAPSSARFISSTNNFEVKVEPEVAYRNRGKTTYMHVWNTKTPILMPQTAGITVRFMREAFGDPNTTDFVLFDLRLGRLYGETDIPINAAEQLYRQIELIESLWVELNKKRKDDRRKDKKSGQQPPTYK